MITTGQGLRVSSTGSNYVQSGAAGGGMVRYNPSYNRLELWDGNTWTGLATHHIDFDYQVVEVLEWARQRMEQDRRIQKLIQDNPTVADAFRECQKAEDRLRVVVALVEQES